jgi:indole-3-glycerol phosphate synthase
VVAVAESGITGVDDARRCADAGYRAVLVGEHLVRAVNPEKAVSELRVPLPS